MTNKCEACEKNYVYYKFVLSQDILCPSCNHINYKKGDIKLNICSTQCNELPWSVDEYLSRPNDKISLTIFYIDEDVCKVCNKIMVPRALFTSN